MTDRSSGQTGAPATTQARTRRTREAVVRAARELFLEDGYSATTVESICERADVPPATVYRQFGNKVGILRGVLDVSIGGDDEPVAVADRPNVQAMLSDPDPHQLLAGFAAMLRTLMPRTEPVYRVLVDAARTDTDAAALLAANLGQRQLGQGHVATALAATGRLRPELTERDAADVIHAVASPEVHRLLTVDRGWSDQRYESWIRSTLTTQLLADTEPGSKKAAKSR